MFEPEIMSEMEDADFLRVIKALAFGTFRTALTPGGAVLRFGVHDVARISTCDLSEALRDGIRFWPASAGIAIRRQTNEISGMTRAGVANAARTLP